MQINAFTSDINFKRVRAGYRPLEDCQGKERIPFCLGSEFAERGPHNPAKASTSPFFSAATTTAY